jgi:hypothetical protein
VARLKVKVVAGPGRKLRFLHGHASWTVEVGRHRRNEVRPVGGRVLAIRSSLRCGAYLISHIGTMPLRYATVLLVEIATQLDRGDLGDGVGFVGGLQGAGQERIFTHGLRCVLRVDTAGTQVEELVHPTLPRGVDHVGSDLQVLPGHSRCSLLGHATTGR